MATFYQNFPLSNWRFANAEYHLSKTSSVITLDNTKFNEFWFHFFFLFVFHSHFCCTAIEHTQMWNIEEKSFVRKAQAFRWKPLQSKWKVQKFFYLKGFATERWNGIIHNPNQSEKRKKKIKEVLVVLWMQ